MNSKRNGADEIVTTHADARGNWHAKIIFPAPGYGPQYLAENSDRIRAKARRAIRAEIAARQAKPVGPVRVEVTANNVDHMNRMRSITYYAKA